MPSVALSIAAHAALLGAAAHGRGPLAPLFDDPEPSRIYYLPPPDRMPGRRATVERVQFVAVGAGRQPGMVAPKGVRVAGLARETVAPPGGTPGTQAERQVASAPVESSDSVYSMLSEQEAAIRVEGSAAPIYPTELILAGVEGSVHTRYVIDTTGRADSTSFEVLDATHPAFARAVRDAVPGMRFTAAQVNGRHVRQMVEQRFDFRIAPSAAIVPPPAALAEHTRAVPIP
jgi:TonB family protein